MIVAASGDIGCRYNLPYNNISAKNTYISAIGSFPVESMHHHFRKREISQMTRATIATTISIPAQMPASNMSPTSSQELRVAANTSRTARIERVDVTIKESLMA